MEGDRKLRSSKLQEVVYCYHSTVDAAIMHNSILEAEMLFYTVGMDEIRGWVENLIPEIMRLGGRRSTKQQILANPRDRNLASHVHASSLVSMLCMELVGWEPITEIFHFHRLVVVKVLHSLTISLVEQGARGNC